VLVEISVVEDTAMKHASRVTVLVELKRDVGVGKRERKPKTAQQ
jgi:hypothetical protein